MPTLPQSYLREDKVVKKITHDETLLLRISTDLLSAIDQVIKEKIRDTTANRSEFIRRAIRYTIDNIDEYAKSETATVKENTPVESIAKINKCREIFEDIHRYTESVLAEPSAALSEKRHAFLLRLVGQLVFEMSE
jgi:metal-responsive CopG/Arc/MetJ family transcriptional regulator